MTTTLIKKKVQQKINTEENIKSLLYKKTGKEYDQYPDSPWLFRILSLRKFTVRNIIGKDL